MVAYNLTKFLVTSATSYLNANSATDPNSATGNAGAAILTAFINDTKTMLSDMSVSLKIGNADAGSYFNDLVLEDVDYGVRPYAWFFSLLHLLTFVLDGQRPPMVC